MGGCRAESERERERERETRAPVRDGDSIKPPPKQLHNPYKANKNKEGFMRCIDQVDDVSRNNAQQTKTNYNQEERDDGDVGETEQPNNRQKQTKNMKNITQKFRFRLTFSLGLDSGVGAPYMQFQA